MSATENYSTRINQVSVDILEIEKAITPLQAALNLLQRELEHLKSKEFIQVNNIKKDDIEMSGGEGLPWFGTCWSFAEWLKKQQTTKHWVEWNGRIYHMSDMLQMRMPGTPGLVDDL